MAKILVLDDVLDAGNLVKRILQKKGHEVAAFTEEEDDWKNWPTPPEPDYDALFRPDWVESLFQLKDV